MKTFKTLTALFIALIYSCTANAALPKLPTKGSCGFLITQPVPLGANVTNLGETLYNLMGVINFTSATTGTLSGYGADVIYQTIDSPKMGTPTYMNNATVTIAQMTSNNGFVGGYILSVSGTGVKNGVSKAISFVLNAVPISGGNALLLQLAGAPGTGPGPGSGTCEF